MIRQIHTCAALNVSPQHRSLVGIPTFHDTNCNQSHKETSECVHCRWNLCQGCGGTAWARLSPSFLFRGWTGYCGSCVAPASLPDIPDEWKEFYTEKAVPVISSGKARKVEKDEVITIADDDEQALEQTREQLKKEFPILPDTWEIPDSGDIREYTEFKLFNAQEKVIKPKYVLEILSIVDELIKARRKSSENKDPIPFSFQSFIPPEFFMIQEITRIQNYRQTKMYRTAIEEATYNNEKRKPPNRAPKMEDVAFHGTNDSSAFSIAKFGPHTKCNKNGAYGWGVYLSLADFAIPLMYAKQAFKDLKGDPALVMGMSLTGKRSKTPQYQAHPNSGEDTGGCGNDWVHVIFDDYHFNPEYVIIFSMSTQKEWEDQVKLVQEAAVDAGSSPFRVLAGIAGSSKSSSPPPAAVLQSAWPGVGSANLIAPSRVSAASMVWPVLSTGGSSPSPATSPTAITAPAAISKLQSMPVLNIGASAAFIAPPVVKSAAIPVASVAIPPPQAATAIPVAVPPAQVIPPPQAAISVAVPPAQAIPPPKAAIPVASPPVQVIPPPQAAAAIPVALPPLRSMISPPKAAAAIPVAVPPVPKISPPKARAAPTANKRTPKKACLSTPSQYKATPPTSDDPAESDSDDPGYKPGVRARK